MSVGMWRAAVSGWTVLVPVVVGDASVQALLIWSDPVPALSAGFIALTVGSALALLVAVWLTTCAASAAVDGEPRAAIRRAWQRPFVLAWALAFGIVAVAASLLESWLAPVVLILAAFVLPAAAAGERNALAGLRLIVRAPVRSVLAVVAAMVAVLLSWLIALILGFFVTGLLAAFVTWLWFGAVSTLLLCRWCSLYTGMVGRATGVSAANS